MRDQNKVLRFPDSSAERKRILYHREDSRLRLVALLRSVCGWLLVVALSLFLISHYEMLTPTAVRRVMGYAAAGLRDLDGEEGQISYVSGSFTDAALFSGGLAYTDSDTFYVSKAGGLEQLSLQVSYGSPTVEVSDTQALIYDRGGTGLTVANALSPVYQKTLECSILSASIGKNGNVVVVTDETGYKTAVTVLGGSGKQLFKWSTSDYYAITAALSPDGGHIAVLAVKQNELDLEGHLLFFDTGKQEGAETDVLLGDTVGLAVRYLSSNTAAAVCDTGIFLCDRRDGLLQQVEYTADNVIAYAFGEDSLYYALDSYTGGARCELYRMSATGALSEDPLYLHEELQSISAAGNYLALLTSSGVTLYRADLTAQWSSRQGVGARRLLVDEHGTCYALFSKYARVITDGEHPAD
jgi:hypothetical protein